MKRASRGYVVAIRRNGSTCGCMGPYSTRKVAAQEADALPLAGAEAVVLGASDSGFNEAWDRLTVAYRQNTPVTAALAAMEAKDEAKKAARAAVREVSRSAGDVGEALAELVHAATKHRKNRRARSPRARKAR